ncbi:MAG: hypothetical protein MUC34_00135 [Anaerolineae bacterium]|jgi:hypothetical protein|nr:hypothetical protein [Anaerolineae bacterium]
MRASAPWVLLLWLAISAGATLFACCDVAGSAVAPAMSGHHHDEGTSTSSMPCPTLSDLAVSEPDPVGTNSNPPDRHARLVDGCAYSFAARAPDGNRKATSAPPPSPLAVYRATLRLRI